MFKVQDIHKTAGFKVHTLTNGSFKENCYVVEQLKTLEISIVDPGSQFEAIRDYLYQLNLSPTQILLTHGHFDHIGVIDELVVCFKCPCYVNSAEKKLIRQAGIYAYRFDRMRLLPPTFLTYFDQSLDAEHTPHNVNILFSPGHTSGGVTYLFGSELLFTGDSLFHSFMGPTNYPTSNYQDLLLSLQRLFADIPDECLIFPGHGKPWSIIEAKEWWDKVKENPPQFHLFGDVVK